jgi:hypothetical protein
LEPIPQREGEVSVPLLFQFFAVCGALLHQNHANSVDPNAPIVSQTTVL